MAMHSLTITIPTRLLEDGIYKGNLFVIHRFFCVLQMVQAIQVLRFHLLELEKVSSTRFINNVGLISRII